MTADLKTIVGQMRIIGGSWQNEAANQIAVREPQSHYGPGAGKGDLFVLIEIQGKVANQEAAEQRLAQLIRDTYYLSKGSATSSLRRALQAANDQLYTHNKNASPDKQVIAGAGALVTTGSDAFVAQIGPVSFFAMLRHLIRRYPTKSPWLDETDTTPTDKKMALGSTALSEPQLHHLEVAAGDMLILADSQLARHVALEDMVRAVDSQNAKGTIKNISDLSRSSHCSALALAIVPAEQSAFATITQSAPQLSRFFDRSRTEKPTAPTASRREAPILAHTSTGTPTSTTVQGKSVLPNLVDWFRSSFQRDDKYETYDDDLYDDDMYETDELYETEAPRQPVTRRQASASPPPVSNDQPFDEPELPLEPEPTYEPETPVHPRSRVMASMATEPSFRGQRKVDTPFSLNKIIRWIGATLLMTIALLGSGLKNVLAMVLPGVTAETPRQAGMQAKPGESAIPWTLMRNIAIAIPLLIAIIVSVSYLQKGRLQEAEYQEFVAVAQNKYGQAQALTNDPGAAIGLMAEAELSLVAAEAIKGPQPEIEALRLQMGEATDRVGNVQRLLYLPQLRQYSDQGTSLSSIVVEGLDLYIMDLGTDRIFHHRLDDLGETLLPDDASLLITARGETVDSITVTDLLGMVWMPTGGNRQTSDLVILNSTGLLEYNPNWGITTSALAGSELMVLPKAVSSYFGNFYILDPQAGQLLRYLPTADGYSTQPESYFPPDQPVDLSDAVDFAIDGAIYVLYSNGHLSKFEGGVRAEFNVTGLDIPFNNPVSVFTAPDEDVQYIYVADAGNQRIVQLEKDGRFVRQLKPQRGNALTFANLQDVYVDEIGQRLYILDSNNLYLATLPTGADEAIGVTAPETEVTE
ncbi:MAG: hypothetical protein AAF485_01930 [Chloroflexota bacterium]